VPVEPRIPIDVPPAGRPSAVAMSSLTVVVSHPVSKRNSRSTSPAEPTTVDASRTREHVCPLTDSCSILQLNDMRHRDSLEKGGRNCERVRWPSVRHLRAPADVRFERGEEALELRNIMCHHHNADQFFPTPVVRVGDILSRVLLADLAIFACLRCLP